jgi:hypothetical protein
VWCFEAIRQTAVEGRWCAISIEPTAEPVRFSDLTAAESYVLRYLLVTKLGAEPFKLALQELVCRDALRIAWVSVPRALGLGHARRVLVTGGSRQRATDEAALRPLLELHAATPHRSVATGGLGESEGVLLGDLAKAARKQFGGYRGYGGYAETHVAPALRERGLLEVEHNVGLSLSSRHRHTSAGRSVELELDRWMERARRGATAALLAQGGAAVLVLHHFHPELRLFDRLASGGEVAWPALSSLVPGAPGGVDVPDPVTLDLLSSGLGDIGDALSALDLAFPGGEGGDGGGGDGSN